MRSRNPLFRRFSRLDALQIVDMALSELEQSLRHLDRPVPQELHRVGAAMQQKLNQLKTAPEICHHITRRALLSGEDGYASLADMILDLHRTRTLVADEVARREKEKRLTRLAEQQDKRAKPGFADRALRPLSITLTVLIGIGLLAGGGVALHYLYPNGLFLTPVEVPSLVGQNLRQATPDAELFSLDVTYQFHSDTENGTILSQSPSPGMTRRVSPGRHPCTLSLLVSLGPAQVQVGDYVGMTKYQAMSQCRRLSLIPVIKTAKNHPAGNVASSDPPAGTVVTAGSSVILYVGTAHHVAQVVVPNLVENNEVGAKTMLSSLGLVCGGVSYLASDRPAGTVIAQSILSGTTVSGGTKVSLVVSKGA